MKVLCDTSVLVAALVESHPMHALAFPWLERAKGGEVEVLASTHSVAELYAVLTSLPLRPRISPAVARQLIDEIVEDTVSLIELSVSDYTRVIARMAELGLAGGTVYDALIARAAEKSGVDHLITFNERDFRRVWPDGEKVVTKPWPIPEGQDEDGGKPDPDIGET